MEEKLLGNYDISTNQPTGEQETKKNQFKSDQLFYIAEGGSYFDFAPREGYTSNNSNELS